MITLPPNRNHLLFFCIVHICSSLFSYAQDDPLKIERFTTENGLSSNVVYCVLQDKKGFLWIGTNDGLNRYDGYEFKTFRSDPNDSSSLPGNSVMAICEDQDGNLWIGSSGGVCRYNYEKNNFTKVPLINQPGASQILQLNKDELLMNTGKGYLSLNIHSLKSTPVKTSDKFRDFYTGTIITRDNKENFYTPVVRGDTTVILKYQKSSKIFTEFLSITREPKLLDGGRVFFVDSRNGCWIGAGIEGNLFHYLSSKGSTPVLKNCLIKKAIGSINQIFEDKDGKIWISAAKGLFKYDYNTDSLNEIRYNSSPGSSNSTLTMSIFQDRSGLIWISSYNGLFKLNPALGKFRHFKAGQHPIALKDNFILGIYPAAENKVWINYQWGIRYFSLFDISNQTIQHFTMNDRRFKTFIREAYLQNPQYTEENELQKWMDNFAPLFLPLPFFLIFDKQKNLWFSTNVGLGISGKGYSLEFTYTLLDEKISGDDIWLATDGGGLQSFNTITRTAAKYVFNGRSTSISNNHLTCLLPEKNGNLWIGTKGGGLNYFDRQKNIFFHYTTRDGLSNNSIFSLVRDDKGRLWIGTANGLSCLDTATHTFKNYFRSDGLVNSEFNRYSACKLDNGYILMGGMDGIDYFHPDSVMGSLVIPRVQITDFKVYNKSILPDAHISLAHDNNYVTIDFAAMDFRNPSANKFTYMLKGIDKDWVMAGNQNSVSYATLVPGRYHFLVKAAGSDGVWNEEPAEVYFTISTPWWKTWLFYSSCVLSIAAILFWFYKYRIRQLKKIIRLRTKISQDLHDDVGATLSGIRVFSQLAKERPDHKNEYLDKITVYSDEMLNKISEIVWSLNAENDGFEQLVDKLRSYAGAMTTAKNIRLEFYIDPVIQKKGLPKTLGKNIYMITREAINNAVKYAQCNSIRISLSPTFSGAELIIADDGKGFDKNNITAGNGLSNMHKRAEEIQGILSVETAAGKGTLIRLSVKFT